MANLLKNISDKKDFPQPEPPNKYNPLTLILCAVENSFENILKKFFLRACFCYTVLISLYAGAGLSSRECEYTFHDLWVDIS